jgi:hypothetical protein
MLEDLDTIDWSKIHHAYGPAEDIPATLRTLASGSKKQREQALWELHGNIWHQGTVYEATAYVVPFLLELVSDDTAAFMEILGLLALIASGSSYLQVHGRRADMSEEEYSERLNRELDWVAQSRRSVGRGAKLFMDLIDAKDPRLREMGVLLLGLTLADAPAFADISTVEVIEKIFGVES